MMQRKADRGRVPTCDEGGYEALQSMLKGEYTEESTGARTIRQTGGKDRHSKVFTSKGPRDRRVRLSVATAIRFYDLQDRLGFEQPSKAVEWLLLHCQPSIEALPQLGSLQPMSCVAEIPKPMRMDRPPPQQQHQGKENHDDQITHYNRGRQSHHHNHALHSLASYNDFHVQASIEEDPPQSSNPSSSGASSDHPVQLSEATWPDCKALSNARPVMPDHVASSFGLRQRPASPNFSQMNKRSRMQNLAYFSPHQRSQADNYSTFTSNGSTDAVDHATMHPLNQRNNCSVAAAGGMFGTNYSDIAPLNYSSLNNNGHINSSFINENNALLLNNNMQGQLNVGMQPNVMRVPPTEPNQYVDITQLLLTGQANKNANDASPIPHNVVQLGALNHSLFDRGEVHQACTSNNLSDTIFQIYSYKAGSLQQAEEQLLVSNIYTSPSPSESTSINTIAGAYNSKAAGSNNIANTHEEGNLVYRPSWSTLSLSGLKQENLHHSLL